MINPSADFGYFDEPTATEIASLTGPDGLAAERFLRRLQERGVTDPEQQMHEFLALVYGRRRRQRPEESAYLRGIEFDARRRAHRRKREVRPRPVLRCRLPRPRTRQRRARHGVRRAGGIRAGQDPGEPEPPPPRGHLPDVAAVHRGPRGDE